MINHNGSPWCSSGLQLLFPMCANSRKGPGDCTASIICLHHKEAPKYLLQYKSHTVSINAHLKCFYFRKFKEIAHHMPISICSDIRTGRIWSREISRDSLNYYNTERYPANFVSRLDCHLVVIVTQNIHSHEILNHWGWVTHICVGNLTITGPDNGLSPCRHQAIIWTNAGILLIRSSGTNISDILTKIYTFSFKKIHLKMPFGK